MALAGKRDLYSTVDYRTMQAQFNVDWHGTNTYKVGSDWNQWETGEGTGGGRVKPYSTDDYLHSLRYNRAADKAALAEEEAAEAQAKAKADDAKTLAEKRQEKVGAPGLTNNVPVSGGGWGWGRQGSWGRSRGSLS